MGKLQLINSIKELFTVLNNAIEINLYGAGFYLNMFLTEIKKDNSGYLDKINRIIVSEKMNNVSVINNIKVVPLTLGERYIPEVYEKLKKMGVEVYKLDFNMFQKEAYEDVKQSIQPFIEEFPHRITGMNIPVATEEIFAWTCWWQGLGEAPNIVKACIESQKQNLPNGVRQVVLSIDNYRNYIDISQYVLDKVDKGDISLTTLSDMIGASVLYKYGGFWMDATLFVSEQLENDILMYPLYTRNMPGTQYCTNAMWANWFLYVKKGNLLFQFLMEAFFIII